jgi:hypothetical protein
MSEPLETHTCTDIVLLAVHNAEPSITAEYV